MRILSTILNMFRFNRKNWRAVILCTFAATVFWFFNALNKNYTTNLNFPLQFQYDEEQFIPVTQLPQYVRINVTGNGWDLFKRSTGVKVAPLELPVDRPLDTKKIVGSTLPVYFTSQMDGLEINYVLTDTLVLDIEPKRSRWMSLAIDSIDYNFKKGFVLASAVSLMPDSVLVTGPARLINAFQEPYPVRLRQRNIDEDFMDDVEVAFPYSEVIKRDPPTVAVLFDVEKSTLRSDSVLVGVVNTPSTVSFVETRYVPITIEIPENLAADIRLDSARAILDLKGFTRGTARILPVVKGLPPFVKVVKLDSIYIRL